MRRRCKLPVKQVRTCPVARVKFIKEVVHGCQASRNELFDLGITGKFHVVIEPQERKNEATERVRRWVGCHLLKEDALLSNGYAHTAIQDIQLEGTDSTPRHFKKGLLGSKSIRPQEN